MSLGSADLNMAREKFRGEAVQFSRATAGTSLPRDLPTVNHKYNDVATAKNFMQ